MRQIIRPVRGFYLDARVWQGSDDRSRRLQLGKETVEAKLDGILFSPDERSCASGIVVLKPECLGKPVQADHFKFLWNGERIHVLYSFGKDRMYDPDILASADNILAA